MFSRVPCPARTSSTRRDSRRPTSGGRTHTTAASRRLLFRSLGHSARASETADHREAALDRKAVDLASRLRDLEGALPSDAPDLVRLRRTLLRIRLQRHRLRRRADLRRAGSGRDVGGSQPPPTLDGIRDRGAWPQHITEACAAKFHDADRSPLADATLQARWD